MMLAFETRCRQFQLGVQGYRSLQKEDQRSQLLNLKTKRRQPTLKDVMATKPSCEMQFKLSNISKYIQPKKYKEVYEALSKEGSDEAQFESMKTILDRLKDHLQIWQSSSCEKCSPFFHKHSRWIGIVSKEIDRLIKGQEEPELYATSFYYIIQHLKVVINMFSKNNKCVTIQRRTKTQQGEKPPSEKKPKQPGAPNKKIKKEEE